ncbi:MAG: hypothetical protein IKG93_05465 [Clostridiales bacterium]|nr:hypothetical protein [Clostridiales bacterium]
MRKASFINGIRGLVVLALLMSAFGYTSFSVNATDEGAFSLIDYVTNHQIDTHEEFNEVLEIYCGQAPAPVPDNEISFQVYVDYENNMVVTAVVEDISQTRGSKTGRADKAYYSDAGVEIFTIVVEGRFYYTSTQCTTYSASGSFNPSPMSSWTSTPTIYSGNYSPTCAYAKTAGTAHYLSSSISYSVSLSCDTNGNLSGY